MQNLYEDLVAVLATDDRLVADGHLMKNKVVELALRLDAGLLRLVRSHERLRQHFFVDVDGVAVFDKVKFQQFVSHKAFLPDSYTAFKNKIGLMVGDQYLAERQDVVLAWPYKDCVLEGGQDREDAQRQEVFWNETLAPDQIDRLLTPKALVGAQRYTREGVAPATALSSGDNLIIKGNNLLALHTLMPLYEGEVKLIFIDPPFNTENDSFKYNDRFTQSTWLTFMRNRLQVARRLLASDGSMFLHIDHDHSHLARMVLNDVFGQDNFRNEIILPGRAVKGLQKQFETVKKLQVRHDTLLWYTRNTETAFKTLWVDKHGAGNPEGHWHHAWSTEERKTMQYELLGTKINKGQWVWGKERAEAAVESYERFLVEGGGRTLAEYWRDTGEKLSFIRRSPEDGKPQYWRAPAETQLADTVWMGVPIYASGDHGFKTAKNEKYIAQVLKLASNPGDLVIDFFSGSGTTVATAHKMGRRWIGIEQMDYASITLSNRLHDAIKGEQKGISKEVHWQGGGSFVYAELAQANATFMQSIQNCTSSEELALVWSAMQERAFLSYRVDVRSIDPTAKEWQALTLDNQKRLLMETLDKNMLYVPLSEIDDTTWGISEADKTINRGFFGV